MPLEKFGNILTVAAGVGIKIKNSILPDGGIVKDEFLIFTLVCDRMSFFCGNRCLDFPEFFFSRLFLNKFYNVYSNEITGGGNKHLTHSRQIVNRGENDYPRIKPVGQSIHQSRYKFPAFNSSD